jgi:two-component system response regulator RegX3
MATIGVYGTADFYERLAGQGQAGGDLSLARLGPIDGPRAAPAGGECALLVAPCDAADPASLERVRAALPRLGAPALVLVGHATPAVLTALLEAGAAEAISDALSPREIVAHLRALLRPPGGTGASAVRCGTAGRLAVDRERYEATVEGRALELTRREFSLLAYLVDHAGRACRREDLAREVWAGEITARSRSIDMHIARLREKLAGAGLQVTTLPGIGYRLDAL